MLQINVSTPLLRSSVGSNAGSAGTGCGYPGAPAHSSVRFAIRNIDHIIDEEDALLNDTTLPEGTVATYSCERGFELLGPGQKTCKLDGDTYMWDPDGVPFCVLNVAGGKAPMQSSTMDGAAPQHAVDGSSSQVYVRDTCTLTRPERKPWWYVNLLEPYMVQLVRLDFGKPCCSSYGTITVRVGNNRPDLGTNPICNQFTGTVKEGDPLFLPCNPPMPGAFVSVHLEVPKGVGILPQLSLCEAFVYTDQALPIERCPQFRDQPPGSTATYNGKCYIFYNRNPLIFTEALEFCRARGGTLVDESNPALQGFISWELWRRHRSDTANQYWIGAIRNSNDRTSWKWAGSGEEVSISFWSFPQSTEENCARYDGSNGWLWSATSCTARLYFICQHQPRACGRPEQPPNSTMLVASSGSTNTPSNIYEVGATVEYSCNVGSLLIGPSVRTCLDTGFYNEFPPVCKSIECGYPASIRNGGYTLINNTVSFLSQVLYSCDEGYEMTGRALLMCDVDERWNGPPPRCEPIRCAPPAAIAHGYIEIEKIDKDESVSLKNNFNRSLLVNSVVTYTCEKGYRLVGSRQITCLSTGFYDRVAPTCTEDSRTTVIPPTRGTIRSTTVKTRPYLTPRVRTTTSTSTATTSTTSQPSRNVPGTAELPATVRETVSRRPSIGLKPIQPSSADTGSEHPQDNEISQSVDHAQAGIGAGVPEPSGPFRVDSAEHPSGTHQAKLNLGAVIALGVFGGFVFLAAVITTVVILIRRNRGRSSKHYRHRASPDCNTVASFDSSSSESRGGLNRYYRQAWENLHETTGHKAGHPPLRRKETLDEPGYRENFRGNNTERDGSELVVSDVAAYPSSKHASVSDKKRHHHHHHHHHGSATPDWRQSQSHHRY
ncbi:uncharacterized protein LOC105839437 isoform X2 [Monomorium pharaonis]|uniref:uncharacterized protein LOC105839437 isoform X2 n=1 Tax=Monomorium pharaonis TaxID=307658 RepID=UPI001745D487|nr:uncharacterized protein LOC105839437 isoform X2 [Monomorium pharaonis]